MSLFPKGHGLNEFSRPRIWSTTPEFGSKRTPHLRSTVPNVQRHMAYFAQRGGRGTRVFELMMMILLLFLQKQNLASAIYLFGLGTRLSGPGLKHMR